MQIVLMPLPWEWIFLRTDTFSDQNTGESFQRDLYNTSAKLAKHREIPKRRFLDDCQAARISGPKLFGVQEKAGK